VRDQCVVCERGLNEGQGQGGWHVHGHLRFLSTTRPDRRGVTGDMHDIERHVTVTRRDDLGTRVHTLLNK